MREHYLEFLKRADMPSEANDYLLDSFNTLVPAHENELKEIIDYLYSHDCSVPSTVKLREELAEKTNIHLYTVNFIFLVLASKRMLSDFRKKGIDDEIFWETILDLKYKLFECKTVKGVWGNFVEHWYDIFFKCNIVKLGRLEFERLSYPEELPEITYEGVKINHGDTVYSVHIPSCGKFTKEMRADSYKRAKEFFKEETGEKPMVLFCESWLMNPDNLEIFPESMNIIEFQKEFYVFHKHIDPDYGDCWRVFGKEYEGNPDDLPQSTTMQKCIVNWLKKGNYMAYGFGVRINK